MPDPRFHNGDKVRDTITRYEGVVVGVTVWMNGCVRYGVQSKTIKDGKPVEAVWLDEEQVALVKAARRPETKPHGGPDRHEPKTSHSQ